jgi:hypothetical protein
MAAINFSRSNAECALPPISAIPLSADFPMRLQAVREIAINSPDGFD